MTGARRRLAAVLAVGVLLVARPSAHVGVAPVDLRELVAASALIVRGRVTAVQSRPTPARGIETVATILVERRLKGDGATQGFVSVVVPGGQLGNVRTVLVGAPVLATGDRAVFFLARGIDGVWRPIGLAAGIYRVEATSAGLPVVRAPLVGGRTVAAGTVTRGDAARPPMTIGEFEDLVGLVETAPARRAPVPRAR